jgi:hypothetical protein
MDPTTGTRRLPSTNANLFSLVLKEGSSSYAGTDSSTDNFTIMSVFRGITPFKYCEKLGWVIPNAFAALT